MASTFNGFYDHWCHLLLVAALTFDDEARRYLSYDSRSLNDLGDHAMSGFSVSVSAPNYQTNGVSVTLTSNQSVNVQLTPTPLFVRNGTGNTVFDMPTSVARVRIQGRWLNRDTSNLRLRAGRREDLHRICELLDDLL